MAMATRVFARVVRARGIPPTRARVVASSSSSAPAPRASSVPRGLVNNRAVARPALRAAAPAPSSPPRACSPRRRAGPLRAIQPPQVEEEIDDELRARELGIKDIISLWVTQILQTYGDEESKDGAPVCEGSVDDLVGGPIFLALYPYFLKYGGVFKLAFGPKVFMVLSDPVSSARCSRRSPLRFPKGVLAEILEPIMGQGLIPAPYAVWKNRRRQLVPGFHKAWLDHMVGLFGDCSAELTKNLDKEIAAGGGVARVDMEERFCSVSLDIIGLAVFNYDFGSTTRESPIIKAVYTCLQEAAHRSTFYFPYWNIPFMTDIVPRQREFKANMALINDTLNGLIAKAQKFEGTEDLEELQNRDYSKVNDPSLLRFLVDIRGADVTDAQLRDDLMTMLIAGHETTAAVLTWCLFCFVQDPELMAKVQAEIDEVLGPGEGGGARTDVRGDSEAGTHAPVPRRGAASVPRASHSDPAVSGRRALAQGAGDARGDSHQGHGRVHQRVEPAQASGLLGGAAQVRSHPV